jgi:hypothetical protein
MTFDPLSSEAPDPLVGMLLIGGMVLVSCGAVMKFSEFMSERKDELNKEGRGR